MENLQKALRQLTSAKDRLGQQMDALDVTDKHYDKKYEDMQARLDEFYDKIDAAQEEIAELQSRIDFLIAQKISSDNVYKYLLYFDKLYDKFTDKEKKTFLGSFVEKIEIYPTETPNGRILKRIQFRFPLFYDGEEIIGLSWDNETMLETVVSLVKLPPDDVINIELDLTKLDISINDGKPTYDQIKAYVLKKYGLKVSTLYISQIKRKYGIEVGEAYNKPKSPDSRVPNCPKEKEDAIVDALKHFKMI